MKDNIISGTIIGISGRMQAGKNTIASFINEFTNNRFVEKAYGHKMKEMISILTGVPVEDMYDTIKKEGFLPSEWDYKWGSTDSKELVRLPYQDTDTFNNVIRNKMTIREIMQWFGTDAIRNQIHDNAWINALWCDYKAKYNSINGEIPGKNVIYPSWVITDVRFPNELTAVLERKGLIFRVNRPGIVTGNHRSETALDNFQFFDEIIENDGTLEELKEKVHALCIKYKLIY